MPSYKEFYGSNYLNSEDEFAEDKPIEIEFCGTEEITGRNGKPRTRVVAKLEGIKKPLILNSTNATALGKAFGEDFLKWKGRKLKLRKEETKFQGEDVTGIRVTPVKGSK